ncbi:MAG: CHAT domain-containing protein, partial [Planctomycetota bacterium]
EKSLPDLGSRMSDLCDSLAEDRADLFHVEWQKMNRDVAAGNPRKARQSFRRFRALPTEYFYEKDKRLRDICNELRVVGEPLNSILEILKEK